MRLKLAASGSKSGVGRIVCRRSRRVFQIGQVVPAGGHGGVDFVVLEAADIVEVEADAVFEEFQQLRVVVARSRQRNRQLAFHQDLDHALRGAPQRERIARAGRDHADAEAAAQRIQLVGQ